MFNFHIGISSEYTYCINRATAIFSLSRGNFGLCRILQCAQFLACHLRILVRRGIIDVFEWKWCAPERFACLPSPRIHSFAASVHFCFWAISPRTNDSHLPIQFVTRVSDPHLKQIYSHHFHTKFCKQSQSKKEQHLDNLCSINIQQTL